MAVIIQLDFAKVASPSMPLIIRYRTGALEDNERESEAWKMTCVRASPLGHSRDNRTSGPAVVSKSIAPSQEYQFIIKIPLDIMAKTIRLNTEPLVALVDLLAGTWERLDHPISNMLGFSATMPQVFMLRL